MNSAIIVAAGTGKRFGTDVPKQFFPLAGKPMILHVLEKFESCDSIDRIILVLPENYLGFLASINYRPIKRVSCTAGGKIRAESVFNGFKMLDSQSEIVVVHDGARPFVSVDEIAKVISVARERGAACLVAPINDTIKEVANDKILRTVDRRSLRRALTPQAFKFDILLKAFEMVPLDESITDESYLVELAGFEVSTVEGSQSNIKITTSDDLKLAELLILRENV